MLTKSIYVYKTGCLFYKVFQPRMNCRTDLHQILKRPTYQLKEGSKHKYDPANPTPCPWAIQTTKPKQIIGEKLCFSKNANMGAFVILFLLPSQGMRSYDQV